MAQTNILLEDVVKGLECCTQHGSMCGCDCNGHWGWTDGSHTAMELLDEYRTKCPYGNCETGCVKTLAKDALTLLKVQEPVRPIRKPEIFDSLYFCGKCSAKVGFQMRKDDSWRFKCKFCPDCGRRVKWDG